MCRIYQGYVFRCPSDSGGCRDTFFQTQQDWLEPTLVDMFFDKASRHKIQNPRNLIQARTDPKTLGERARRGKEKAATPITPAEVALRDYCQMLLHRDRWREVRDEGVVGIRKAIGACDGGVRDEHCPNKKTVSLWDYFGGKPFTRYCIQCSVKLRASKKAKQCGPEVPRELTKLPDHVPDDGDWRGRFTRADKGVWLYTEKGEFRRVLDARALTIRGARQTSTPSIVTDTTEQTASSCRESDSHGGSLSGDSRLSASNAMAGLPDRSRDSRESSDMYGPGDRADDDYSESNVAQAASLGRRDSQSTAADYLQRLAERSRHDVRSEGGNTGTQVSSGYRDSTTTSNTSGVITRTSSHGGVSQASRSIATTGRRPQSSVSSEISVQSEDTDTQYRHQRRQEQRDTTSHVSSDHPSARHDREPPRVSPRRMPSFASDHWEPERHTTSRQSMAVAQSKRSPRKGEKGVRHEAPGESGDESGKFYREYHKGSWRTHEDFAESEQRRRKQEIEDEKQRRRDRRKALSSEESQRIEVEESLQKARAQRLDELDGSSSSEGTETPATKGIKGGSKGASKSKGNGKGSGKDSGRDVASKKHRKR